MRNFWSLLCSRCAISVFVFSWPEKITTCIIESSTESTPVDVRYLVLYSLGQKKSQHASSSHPSTESTPVEHSRDQKLRNFRLPYLTKSIIIREYLNLGKLSRIHFQESKKVERNCDRCPKFKYSRMMMLFVK